MLSVVRLALLGALFVVAACGTSDVESRFVEPDPMDPPDPVDAEPLPPLEGSEPADGELIIPTAWLRLVFADPVADESLPGFALRCDDEEIAVSAHPLGDDGRELILNPGDELPTSSACDLSWEGPDGPTSLMFDVTPSRPIQAIPYDRTDASRSVPFPDDVWLVEDASAPNGRRVDIPVPEREADIELILGNIKTAIGTVDGFSPLGPIIVELPSAPELESIPMKPAESLEPLATVGLYDVSSTSPSYADRVPFELYTRSMESIRDSNPQHALVLFPSIPLTPGGQYALVVTRRALAGPDQPFAPSDFMKAVLGAAASDEPALVTATREVLEPALAAVADASPPLFDDDVALITRFTIRSTEQFALTPITMRDQARELPPPSFTIESVEPGFGSVEAVVTGTWEAPEWRAGSSISRDDDGLPVLVTTKDAPFVLAIPGAAREGPVPVTMYQHGNPGSAENEVPNQAGRYLAAAGHAVIGFTDNANRELGQNTLAQQAATLGPLLGEGVLPEFDAQTTGEQLAFLRLIEELDELDIVPLGEPDGQPDLDVSSPITYDGISSGATRGQAFVPYAPEIIAAALVVGGGRSAEVLFYQDIVPPSGGPSPLLLAVTLFAPSIRPVDLWLGIGLYQLAYDPQDQHNHASFMYANPLEVGGTLKKPSVLVQEGIGDTLVPNNATRSLVYALGATPLLDPVAQPVSYLERAGAPLVANVDAETTSGYSQFVPAGVPELQATAGCETQFEGHFCAQIAPGALDQRIEFFQTALTDPAPRLIAAP